MGRKLRIRSKALMLMILLAVVPIAAMGVTSTLVTRRVLLNNTAQLLEKGATTANQQLSWKLDLLASALTQIANDQTVRHALLAEDVNETTLQQRSTRIYHSLYAQGSALTSLGMPSNYILLPKNGGIYSATSYRGASESLNRAVRARLESFPWYDRLSSLEYAATWYGAEENALGWIQGKQLYLARNLIMDGRNVGVAMVGINVSYVERMLESFQLTQNSRLSIVDASGQTIVGPEPLREEGAWRLSERIGTTTFDGGWTLRVEAPVADLTREGDRIALLTLGMTLLAALCVLAMVVTMNRWLVRPVTRLSTGMQAVRQGDLTARVPVEQKDEIGQLCEGFNDMTQALSDSMTRLRQDEEWKRRQEIALRQAQINPHFIRNTLNTIRWMAEMRGAAGVSSAIRDFASVIDYSFRGGTAEVALSEELEALDKYVTIQQLRYQNLFTWEHRVPPELEDARVPRLLLQPIVENSILHGIAEKGDMGAVSLEVWREGDDLLLCVRDDGVGMDAERLADVMSGRAETSGRGGTHIGVKNVDDRLRLLYGEPYGLTLSSRPGEGCEALMRIPWRKTEAEGGDAE